MARAILRTLAASGLLAAALLPMASGAAWAVCKGNAEAYRGEVYQKDEFFIHYSLQGENALEHREDLNANGTPDVVEDIMTQLVTMRDMLLHLGFRHPLQQPRYKGVQQIRLRMLAIEKKGLAFDSARSYPGGDCSLFITLGSHLKSGNLTPAHELFHLFQYGYTMFKRPWFLEGMARWSESVLGAKSVAPAPIPRDSSARKAFFNRGYSASEVWYALAYGADPIGRLTVPDSIASMRYVSGRKALEDTRLPGAPFILAVLEALGDADRKVGRENGMPRYAWPESFQRDPQHDEPMWAAIEGVYRNFRPNGTASIFR